MNWHYLVIIAVVFILFISMGDNPFAPPPGYVPPDPFKEGIQAKISTEGGVVPRFGAAGPVMPGMPGYGGSSVPPGFAASATGAPPNMRYQYEQAPSEPAPPPAWQKQPPHPDMPEPFKKLPMSSGGASLYYFYDAPYIRTSEDKPVKFSGSAVQTITDDGQIVAMPDGVYTLLDGRRITVRDGKNILPKNANIFFN